MGKHTNIVVQLGDEFEGNGKASAELEVTVNAQKTAERSEQLIKESGNRFESLNFSTVISIQGGDNEKLTQIVDQLWNQEPTDELTDQRFFRVFRRDISTKTKAETQVANDKFYLKLDLVEELLETVVGPAQGILEMGLSEVSQTQENTIKAKISLNKTVDEITESIKSGNRSLIPLLSQAKFEFTANIDEGLYDPLIGVLTEVTGDELTVLPQVKLFKNFKNLDLKLKFDSFEELPEFIRHSLLPFKKSSEDSDSRKADLENQDHKFFIDLVNALGSSVCIDFFIENFAHINLTISAPQFSVLLFNYFGFLVEKL